MLYIFLNLHSSWYSLANHAISHVVLTLELTVFICMLYTFERILLCQQSTCRIIES